MGKNTIAANIRSKYMGAVMNSQTIPEDSQPAPDQEETNARESTVLLT
jgi:hypothetical protein